MSKEYIELCNRIIDTGHWIYNKRTGKRCLTVINADFEYDCREGHLPMLTTKKAYWKKAIAEMLGYIRGYDNAAQFRAVGTDTWDENSNADWWQDTSEYCTGKDDMGRCYGVQGRSWRHITQGGKVTEYDQLNKVYNNLRNQVDDRGEIITYWNVGELGMACLRPCMYSHTFSLLDNTLYLTSYQRSDDVPLGHGFNQIQVSWFLQIMAQITGHKAGVGYHKIVNAHVYENQLEPLKQQIKRTPYPLPTLIINPDIKTLKDLETWVTLDDFKVENYQHHPAIKFEFSV